ncbi:MAG: hypothetical protein JWM85_1180 [Acidimicrobiaceae bacterium]|nr:hypothetical protein [Acidimicrobiaceae bacterium]
MAAAGVMALLATSLGAGAAFGATALPPGATTGAVTAVMPTTATVSGSVNPHGTATTYEFQYGLQTSTTYTSTTAVKSAGAGKGYVSVSASLTGLSPATAYRYRIVAKNAGGTTDGSAGIFNTSAAPTVLTGAATGISDSVATLNGTVNPQALATTYYFQYGTSTSYGSKTPAKTVPASANPVAVNAVVTGLSPKTTYHFRLVASSSAGSSVGSDFSLTTGLSVILNAAQPSTVYGGFVRLSGTVASGQPGVQVTILREQFNETAFTGIAAVTTGAGGTWQYEAQPRVRSSFEAQANGGTSSPVVISVSPVVTLYLNRNNTLTTSVVGAMSFANHVLQLQKFSGGNWETWKHVRLDSTAKANFTTLLPIGRTPVRMAIGPFVIGLNQAGPGYLAGYSRVLTYVRTK